jgi:hypothetical protein
MDSSFLKRFAEQAVVAFAVGFGGVFLAGGGDLQMSAASGALAAGMRAVYALFVKNVGDKDQPSAM